MRFDSWFIENPVSNELRKSISLKLGPKAEHEFIMVLKTPRTSRSENLVAKLNISLLTYAQECFNTEYPFEDFLRSDYEGSMKAFFKGRKELGQLQRTEVLLTGRAEIPNLICQRVLNIQKPPLLTSEMV